jgi:hypothetical protein
MQPTPSAIAWQDVGTLTDGLNADDLQDARLRLRAALRRVIDEIRLLVVLRGHDRLAAVQIWFNGNE